jgi:hypothetical protein
LDYERVHWFSDYYRSRMEISEQADKVGGKSIIMDIVETISVLAGSLVILGLFLSIGYENIRTKNASRHSRISAINDRWQKITVSAR